MSAVIFAGFGNKELVRSAAVGNAAYDRAVSLGYSRITALQFTRQAKRDGADWETPSEIAMRIVRPKQHSATTQGPRGPGSAA